jgi:anaerobic magnesium-protoporphyrin IX monomethyl ester cyclase
MNMRKPVVLLYPSPSDPTQPYTSLPALTAHLRASGVPVIQRDVGVETFNRICRSAYLAQAYTRGKTVSVTEIVQEHRSTFEARRKRLSSCAEYVIMNVERAVAVMRSRNAFENLPTYRWATSVLGLAMDIASLPHHPTVLSPSNYQAAIDYSKRGLFRAAQKGRENVFHDIFFNETVPSILEASPLLVGISITYHFQLIPAFTLARLLKSAAPTVPIVMGGAYLSRIEDHLKSDADWFDFADYFVVGEGETALLHLTQALESGTTPTPAMINNLISCKGGVPFYSNTCFTEAFEYLPCPDYQGLDLEAYLSPEPVLLMPTTRGCYYGKCTFCDVSRQTRTVYRPLARTRVAENLLTLHQLYGAKRFFFCDDAVPMKNMLEAAGLVTEHLPEITWQAEARLEKQMTPDFLATIYAGGCRELIFGFESASQRVLDLMRKHNRVETDKQVLLSCAQAGMAVNLQTFIGLPGETEEEARMTVDYLLSQERNIASIGFGVFSLYKDTPIYREPDKYHATEISTPILDNLVTSLDFVPTSGMTREAADSVYKEAMEKFQRVFATRSQLLGGASGAHSLLQLSYFSFEELHHEWSRIDHLHVDQDWLNWAPQSEGLVCGDADTGNGKLWLFNQVTAEQAEVGADVFKLIEDCDGSRTIDDLATRHALTEKADSVALKEFACHAKALRMLVSSQVLPISGTEIGVETGSGSKMYEASFTSEN